MICCVNVLLIDSTILYALLVIMSVTLYDILCTLGTLDKLDIMLVTLYDISCTLVGTLDTLDIMSDTWVDIILCTIGSGGNVNL